MNLAANQVIVARNEVLDMIHLCEGKQTCNSPSDFIPDDEMDTFGIIAFYCSLIINKGTIIVILLWYLIGLSRAEYFIK